MTAQAIAYNDLRDELEAERDRAGADYVERGLTAFEERRELLDDLVLLVDAAIADRRSTPVTLAELKALNEAGLIDGWGQFPQHYRITFHGHRAAARARRRRA